MLELSKTKRTRIGGEEVMRIDWLARHLLQESLFTVWTPLQDVGLDQAPLVVCPKSHMLPGFDRTAGATFASKTASAPAFSAESKLAPTVDLGGGGGGGCAGVGVAPPPPSRSRATDSGIDGHAASGDSIQSRYHHHHDEVGELPEDFARYLPQLEWHTTEYKAGDLSLIHI